MTATNTGIWRHNDAPPSQYATVIAMGLGRSGTTMVARVLIEMGVNMGAHLSNYSSEDVDIRSRIRANDLAGFQELCRQRDAAHDTWGFKCPAFFPVMNTFGESVRNPRFIVLFRDVLAISIRNKLATGSDVLEIVMRSVKRYQALVERIMACKYPVLMLSYEKALQFPRETVEAIASFAGATPTSKSIDCAVHAVVNGDPQYLGGDTAAPSV